MVFLGSTTLLSGWLAEAARSATTGEIATRGRQASPTTPPTRPLAVGSESDVSQNAEGQPNILVLMTDDQRFDTLEFMPTVQQLQAQGVTFTNSFVTISIRDAHCAAYSL